MYAARCRTTLVRYCQSVYNCSASLPTAVDTRRTPRTGLHGPNTDGRTTRTGHRTAEHSEVPNQGYRPPLVDRYWPDYGPVMARYGSESGLTVTHLWPDSQPGVSGDPLGWVSGSRYPGVTDWRCPDVQMSVLRRTMSRDDHKVGQECWNLRTVAGRVVAGQRAAGQREW